ncbi:MAG: hypothetical protein LKE40_12085 [Spirochaetia bacterium]|nr:hypothetical protein [Spirochaetia bacterium]
MNASATLSIPSFSSQTFRKDLSIFFSKVSSLFNDADTGMQFEDSMEYQEMMFTLHTDHEDEILDIPLDSEVPAIRSCAQILQDARKYLEFSVTTLSAILKVTRPTVYSYLEGGYPANTAVEDKIKKIQEVLTIFTNHLGTRSTYFALTRKFDSQGKTLIDYLSENREITEFANRLCDMELQKSKITVSHKQRQMSNAFYSVPVYLDEDKGE